MKAIKWHRGILGQLLLWTAIVMAVFVGVQTLFFLSFGDDVYTFTRTHSLKGHVSSLQKHIKDFETYEKAQRSIESLYWQEGIYSGITDMMGIPKAGFIFYDASADWTVKDEEGQILKLNMATFVEGSLNASDFEMGQTLEIAAFPSDRFTQYYFPVTIKKGSRTFTGYRQLLPYRSSLQVSENEVNAYDSPEIALQKQLRQAYQHYYEAQLHAIAPDAKPIKRTVTLISTANPKTWTPKSELNSWVTLDETQEWLMTLHGKALYQGKDIVDGPIVMEREDSYLDNRYVAYLKPIQFMGKPHLLFSYIPLEKNRETFNTIWFFQLTTAAGAFVLSLLASAMIAARFVRPFLQINGVAQRMAELDFSQMCVEGRKDEVGMLATSINRMSRRLQTTMGQMQGINTQLSDLNDKLKLSLEQKHKADIMRKQFLADVSHELKTPLTVIKGVAEGLEMGLYKGRDQHYANRIIDEVNDLTRLVHDLLEVSRLESGELEFSVMPVALQDVVYRIHRRMKLMADKKNLTVSLDLADCFVVADADKLESVVRNLYSNAVQYTPEGGRIDWKLTLDGDTCTLSVTNSPGYIPPLEIPHLMEPYYRLEKSRSRENGGTGLGLAIVRGILERHSSGLVIENVEGGVCMKFSLSVIEDPQWHA